MNRGIWVQARWKHEKNSYKMLNKLKNKQLPLFFTFILYTIFFSQSYEGKGGTKEMLLWLRILWQDSWPAVQILCMRFIIYDWLSM